MRYDLDETFGEIFKNDISALQTQLIDIQHYQADRSAAERWWENGLRFIDVSGVPDLKQHCSRPLVSYKRKPQQKHGETRPPRILPLLQQSDDDMTVDYVAVSWRWTKGSNTLPPWGCDMNESFDYQICRPGQDPHRSEFPNHYLERVIMFAQSQKVSRVWIDKECIYQRPGDEARHPNDLNLGVQIMDAVYGGARNSVALLTTSLMYQHEVCILDELLSRSIFVNPKDTKTPQYKPGLGTKIMEVQMLILRILSDPRWSRGWIFQEDHLASNKMTLLIPYSGDIKTDGLSYSFGALPGNLQVMSHELRQSVTMFCMASDENELRWPNSEMLSKLKQYNMWNKKFYKTQPNPRNKHGVRVWTRSHNQIDGSKMNQKANYENEPIYPSSTSSILDDICSRSLFKMEDMVAIMANAAKFFIRLDITPESPLVKSDEYSLSAILLALVVLNGEILITSKFHSDDSIMNHTLRSYLEKIQYRFCAPMHKLKQSFIDRCRLKSTTITSSGIEVQGFLYKLLPANHKPTARSNASDPLRLSTKDRSNLYEISLDPSAHRIPTGSRFNLVAKQVILMLIGKLEKCYSTDCRLANFLQHYIDLDFNPPFKSSAIPSTPYILDMMAGIVQALIDDRQLRFARLDSEPDSAPPSAIFITPLHGDGWVSEKVTAMSGDGVGRSWVFVSWDSGWRNHGMERLASIEVAPFRKQAPGDALKRWDDKEAEESKLLRSYGWVDGVFAFKSRDMGRYTFPFPGLSGSVSDGDGGEKGLKRTLADMLNSSAEQTTSRKTRRTGRK